jgi:hypothetical protein
MSSAVKPRVSFPMMVTAKRRRDNIVEPAVSPGRRRKLIGVLSVLPGIARIHLTIIVAWMMGHRALW